jgi:hypothetical protein
LLESGVDAELEFGVDSFVYLEQHVNHVFIKIGTDEDRHEPDLLILHQRLDLDEETRDPLDRRLVLTFPNCLYPDL